MMASFCNKGMLTSVMTLIILILFIPAFAQDSEHLKFKGVPIDGTLDDYVAKMNQAGFTLVESDNGTALLEGDFAGYKNCTIGIQTMEKQDIVHQVAVVLSSDNKWGELVSRYDRLKSMLTEKYGKPKECVEKFYNVKIEDKEEINRVMNDMVTFYFNMNDYSWNSVYEMSNGSIYLGIENHGINNYVILRYIDAINSEKFNDAAMEDL